MTVLVVVLLAGTPLGARLAQLVEGTETTSTVATGTVQRASTARAALDVAARPVVGMPCRPAPRGLPRWRDLRCGGLPAPRAPGLAGRAPHLS